MNIYFNKKIYDENKQFYDDCFKCVDDNYKIDTEKFADIKEFIDNRIDGLHDRLSYIAQIRGDLHGLDKSIRDIEITENHIENEIKKIIDQIKSTADIIEKQSYQQKIINERIDKFVDEFEILKYRLKTYSNIVFFLILIYTIVECSEKFFGFNFSKFSVDF